MERHALHKAGNGVSELILTGDYGLADAAELKDVLLQALADSPAKLVVDLKDIGETELPFIQLLFALSAQARLDGRLICLRRPLPGSLLGSSARLGISSMDFEQAFDPE